MPVPENPKATAWKIFEAQTKIIDAWYIEELEMRISENRTEFQKIHAELLLEVRSRQSKIRKELQNSLYPQSDGK